jgi:hypothetical protein
MVAGEAGDRVVLAVAGARGRENGERGKGERID